MKRIVIIGGVAAGMSAASKIRRMDKNVQIDVYEKGPHISYGACGLPYYISGVTPSVDQLFIRTPEQFGEQGIHVHTRHEALRVYPDQNHVLIKDLGEGQLHIAEYDQLLIATGTSPIVPDFAEGSYDNVFTLKSVEDGERIKSFLQHQGIQNVTIVGAGYIGMELAETFYEMNKEVTVVELQPEILPQFDQELAKKVREQLMLKGIRFFVGEQVESFRSQRSSVHEIVTNKRVIEADAVIVNIGVRPSTQFLRSSGIELGGRGEVMTDAYMRTNFPNIYAAGDCASCYHRVLKRPVHIALGTIANKQGRLAAENMMHEPRAFPGVLGTSIAKILDFTVAKTGISEKEAKQYEIPYRTVTVEASSHASYYPDPKPIWIKLVYEPERKILLGAQMVGESGVAKRIDVFATAITNRMTTEEIGYLDLGYAPPYASVWDAVQIAANAAK